MPLEVVMGRGRAGAAGDDSVGHNIGVRKGGNIGSRGMWLELKARERGHAIGTEDGHATHVRRWARSRIGAI